ncbi:MAG: hypothetical protein ABEJ36_06085 [Candidatus Nanosalina sp.]
MPDIYRESLREKILKPFYNLYFDLRYGAGTDFMEEDWDNLVLLDACRYDDFREENTLEGELDSRISRATDSPGFIRANFNGKDLTDTVYVTANPHVGKVDEGVFHAVVDEPLKEFSDELGTVPPEKVTEAAIKAGKEYPDKKLVIHYMQPHDPPIGEEGRKIREEAGMEGWRPDRSEDKGRRMMNLLAKGKIGKEEAREAYRENLRIVLGEVEKLLEQLDGKTVVTADHGEMFGESPYPFLGRMYEHWKRPKTLELCRVPWMVVENGDRREIRAGEPEDRRITSEDEIRDKLERLGYK